jgi:hypothetical protein
MRACERARAAFDRSMQAAAASVRVPRTSTLRPQGYESCHDAGRGAWLVTVERPRVRRFEGRAVLTGGEVVLTFFSDSQPAIRASGEMLGPHRLVEDRPPHLVVVKDFDGDSVGELAFESRQSGSRSLFVFTAREGRVERFALPGHLQANGALDVDRDGQIDLVEYVSFASNEACRERSLNGGDLISWVSIRSGATYRPDGDGARAWLRAHCPERPQVIVPSFGVTPLNATTVFRQMLERVACARAWGMSAEAITRTFPARWPAPLACVTAAELTSFAASLRPPVTLAPFTGVTAPAEGAETHFERFEPDGFEPSSLPVPQELPALVRRCAANESAMRRAITTAVAASNQSLSTDELEEFFGDFSNCFVSEARDAWMTSFDRLRWVENTETDENGVEGASRIMHLDVNGRAVSQRADTIERFEGRSGYRRVIATFDFDGDQRSEAFVRSVYSESEDYGGREIELLTVANGAVRPYAPPGGVPPFSQLVDFDGDERPDLLNTRCHRRDEDDEDDESGGPYCLAHSLPDGRFSTDDAVARRLIAQQCSAPPERIVSVGERGGSIDRSETFGAILCARYYGESAERIVHRIFVESRNRDDDDRRWLFGIAPTAARRMPFTLPRPAPVRSQRTAADAGLAP